ncbi:MAG: hypothetical protein FWG81_04980 [Betaproteobacteria bacterium]|nr:hypothetical protein [Betaproteobacteria bacterium]
MQTAIRSPLLTRLESFIQRMMEKMVIRFLLPLVDQKKLCHDFKKLFIFNDYAGVKNSFMGALPHFSTCVGVRVPLTPTYRAPPLSRSCCSYYSNVSTRHSRVGGNPAKIFSWREATWK